jgi:hypothetical protein
MERKMKSPSNFQFFLLFREGKWRGKRIKEIAFWRIKEKCKNTKWLLSSRKNLDITRVFGSHNLKKSAKIAR